MKITQKQLNNYLRSRKAGLDGIGFNDNWNIQNFQMTRDTSNKIDRAISEEYGSCVPTHPDLKLINKRLENVTMVK